MHETQISLACSVRCLVGESPLWDFRDGVLYWIDIPRRALHQLRPETSAHQVWALPAEPGCVALARGGGLIIALRSGIFSFDPRQGRLELMYPAPFDQAVVRFNDGRVDSHGRLWIGTLFEPRSSPSGTLYKFEAGHLIDMHRSVTVGNGVAFSKDERVLYHSDTTAHRITAFEYDATLGKFHAPRTFQEFSQLKDKNYGGRPDGACVDSDDAYWCAMFEGAQILRFSQEGTLLEQIQLPVRCPTSLAFGGEDLRTVFVTTSSYNRSSQELTAYPWSGQLLTFRARMPGRLEQEYRL